MDGGISAWHGLTAVGVPEAGMAFFSKAHRPEELIALSWILEEGSRTFYAAMEIRVQEQKAKSLYHDLTIAEEHHKSALSALYAKLTMRESEPDFPWSLMPEKPDTDVMEGGMKVQEALEWAQGKGLIEVLELSISLETNAYDLYIKMSRHFDDAHAQNVFNALSREEKKHLDRLTAQLDSILEN